MYEKTIFSDLRIIYILFYELIQAMQPIGQEIVPFVLKNKLNFEKRKILQIVQ